MLEDRLEVSLVLLLGWTPVLGLVWLALRRFRRWWLFVVCGYLIVGASYASYGNAVTLLPTQAIANANPWSVEQLAVLLLIVLVEMVAWPLIMLLSPFV